MSKKTKSGEQPTMEKEEEAEFSVEKIIDRRIVNSKVQKI